MRSIATVILSLPVLFSSGAKSQDLKLASLSPRFEPNVGQADPEILFEARGPRQFLALTRRDARIDLAGPGPGGGVRIARIRLTWLGSDGAVEAMGEERLESVSHYYLGSSNRSLKNSETRHLGIVLCVSIGVGTR